MKFYFHDHFGGKSYLLADKLIIGRSSSAGISIPSDDKLSSKHLEIKLSRYSLFIKDLGASNGTTVNGIGIEKNISVEIQLGDIIKIGRSELILSNEENVPEKVELVLSTENTKTIDRGDNLRKFNLDMSEEKKSLKIKSDPISDFDNTDERESRYKKEIRNHKIKIRKLNRSLEKIDETIKNKNELLEKVSEIDNKYLNQEDKLLDLKECYDTHKDDWENWNLKIKKLKRELAQYQEKREHIAPKMEFYEIYLNDKLSKKSMMSEIKKLSRESLTERVYEIENNIKEEEKGIQQQNIHLEDLEKEKLELKRKKKERIKDEIKRLQDELDKAG